MKKYFAEYRPILVQMAKKYGIPLGELKEFAARMTEGNLLKKEHVRWRLELAALEIPTTHYFIESEELALQIINMASAVTTPMIQCVFEEGESFGFIHTCGKTATALLIGRNADYTNLFVCLPDSTAILSTPIFSAEGMVDGVKLAVGTALYLKCFPHALKPGFPESAKHPAHYKGATCVGVSAVPEIIERAGPKPHFRSGYFKCLRSSFFKNRRWDVIFIADTFVKGTAKTISNP